jgi:quercetin dioxygenase-like cupin family protein
MARSGRLPRLGGEPFTGDRTMLTLKFFPPGLAACLFALSSALPLQEPVVKPLMEKALPDLPGKEVLMLTVAYAPGEADAIHRHNAHAFVYVLEGSIVMQVKGGKQVTLSPGQTFYEGPDDVHSVGRNASSTKPARFLVFLLKNTGGPVLVPVPGSGAP